MPEIKQVIDKENGIFMVECKDYEEARKVITFMKKEWPYAIMNGHGCWSNDFLLNLYAKWGEHVDIVTAEDGEPTTCIHCGDCDTVIKPVRTSSPGIISDPERCHHEQFWSKIVQQIQNHFIDKRGYVYYITTGEGGFGNRRYTIRYEDGEVLHNMGVWHNGECPECIKHLFRKAKME